MSYTRHGTLVRLVYLCTACAFWLLTGAGRLKRGQVVVLCFHGIAESQRDRFDRMIRIVSHRAVASQCFVDGSQRGKLRVCLTFDDAFANLLSGALPTLKAHGVPATIFAVSDNLGMPPKWDMPQGHREAGENTMTAPQLQGIACDEVRIGSHTRSHPSLKQLSAEAMRSELLESKIALESIVGVTVDELAFPYGVYDARVVEAAKAVGYGCLYSLEPILYRQRTDAAVIGRFSVDPDMWFIEFVLTCDGAYSWLYQFRQSIQWWSTRAGRRHIRLSSESVG